MTTTREEAERISKTDDVAAAIRYLVDSLSVNAAVDLVHAVMKAVVSDHIVDANKKVEPYAYAYERTDLPEEMRDFFAQSIHRKQIESVPPNWTELPLYTHPAPPSELVKAAEAFIEFIRQGIDLYASDDRAQFARLTENLVAELDKVRS